MNNLISDKIKNTKNITGYTTKKTDGTSNPVKYSATFDYSLDSIKLQEICKTKRMKFSFNLKKKTKSKSDTKEYSDIIINVNFNYGVNEYNQFGSNVYVKFGYSLQDFNYKFNDCVYVVDDELIAIRLNQELKIPEKHLSEKVLGKYFIYDDETKKYIKSNNSIKIQKVKMSENLSLYRDLRCLDLREILYCNGFYCNGRKYVRWKRSSGSSRIGKCLFIDERLYNAIHKYDLCGLKIKDKDKIDLPAFESYISLTTSSIIDTLSIEKENILVINDYKSVFNDEVIAVKSINRKLSATRESEQISNVVWDGQALIDKSLMGEKYKDKGMLLLRNRFFKSCCFSCCIQDWFSDNEITDISQLNGFTLATDIKDIKLITTPSSIKYLKFSTLEMWFDNLDKTFGVVKFEKPPHYLNGKLVQLNYQILNSLQFDKESMRKFVEPTLKYMEALRNNADVLKYHISNTSNNGLEEAEEGATGDANADNNIINDFITKDEIMFELLNTNSVFLKTKLLYDFRRKLIDSFRKNAKIGHILVEGNFSTVCANPIEMLQYSIKSKDGEILFKGTNLIEKDCVYSTRFVFDKKLFCGRSPFVTAGNAWLVTNKDNKLIETYMNPSKEIIYFNAIGENALQRNNGMDMDSDSVLNSDDPTLIALAEKNYDKFLVPTNFVGYEKREWLYADFHLAELDSKIAINLIGEIINLSQQLNSLLWANLNRDHTYNFDELYNDICKLSVLSCVEIDSAKRRFNINAMSELRKIKAKYLYLDKSVLDDKDDSRTKGINKINATQIRALKNQLKDLEKGEAVNKDEIEKINDKIELIKQSKFIKIKPIFFKEIYKRNKQSISKNYLYVPYETSMDYLQEFLNEDKSFFDCYAEDKLVKIKSLLRASNVSYKKANRIQKRDILKIIKEKNIKIRNIWSNPQLNKAHKRRKVEEYKQEIMDYLNSLKSLNYYTLTELFKKLDAKENYNDLLLQILFNLDGVKVGDYFKSNANLDMIKWQHEAHKMICDMYNVKSL